MLREINNLSLSILATFECIILKVAKMANMALTPPVAFVAIFPILHAKNSMARRG
jgi:hypothetical protein